MSNFFWLQQIQSSNREVIGDQAFYLSQLQHRGHPVLPGFVITGEWFWQFLQTIDWLEPLFVDLPQSSLYLDVDEPRQLQAIARRICKQIIQGNLPEDCVRFIESAVTELNAPALTFYPGLSTPSHLQNLQLLEPILGWGNLETALLGLKQTWVEFFRAKSLFYWQRAGVRLQTIRPTVLVQPLQFAIASGFVEIQPDRWEVYSTWGLEFPLNWGQNRPDYLSINPQTKTVEHQQFGSKTITYSLKSSSDQLTQFPLPQRQFGTSVSDFPLSASIVNEDQQNQFSLNAQQIQQLITLSETVATDLKPFGRFNWRLCQLSSDSEPQFYLTQAARLLTPKNTVVSAAELNTASTVSFSTASAASKRCFRGIVVSSGQAMGSAYILPASLPIPEQLPPNTVLVVSSLTLNYLPLLKRTVAIIAEQGGMTCHGAIIARELGIPAIFGINNATQKIKMGEFIFVDGNRAEVQVMEKPNKVSEPFLEANLQQFSPTQPQFEPNATGLMVNISQPSSFSRLSYLPIDGVGLLRSELMAMEVLHLQQQFSNLAGGEPFDWSHWLQPEVQAEFVQRMSEQLYQVASILEPRPIYYRSLDLREVGKSSRGFQNSTAPEFLALPSSANTSFADPTLFDLELRVLLKLYESGYQNVRLILPFIRSVEEFLSYLVQIEKAGLKRYPQFQVWMMAEVPSVLFLLPDYVKAGVQGIAIGTNDLTQLLLGIDRNQSEIKTGLNERHPAVKQAIQQLIKMAREADIPCSICGDAPALYPELIDDLVRWGITSISVSLDAVERTYSAIARSEKRLLLEASRNQLNQ